MYPARRKILGWGYSAFALALCVIGYNRNRNAFKQRARAFMRHTKAA